jgi:tetratricopeptide (TPR) repeat protein
MKAFRMLSLYFMAFTCGAFLLSANARAETLDDANRAFAEGHYHAATLGFQSVLNQNGYSASVLFDLGNSYFQEGDFAHAILAYKRAQWLSPNDPDIAANLRVAQKRAGLSETEPRWNERITEAMSSNSWAWVGSCALILFCLSLLGSRIWPLRGPSFFWLSAVSVLALLTALFAVVFSFGKLREAVVIDKNVTALISPFPSAQVLFSPSSGETLTVQKTYNGFYLVKDSTGRSGWISQSQLTLLIPSTARAG